MTNEKEPKKSMAQAILEDKLRQNILGANKAHSLFGDFGVQAYQSFMAGEDILKTRHDTYNKIKEQYSQMGVVGEPSYPTDADVSAKIMKQISEMMHLISLGSLENILTGIDKLEFKVPEKLKGFTQKGLISKALIPEKQEIDIKKLNEDEQNALKLFNSLTEAYGRMCAYRLVGKTYLSDINSVGKEIEEKYSLKKAA
ncbi:MAG: hypothetical protein Q8P15_02955 [Nanoarchaeota archaeon]|nr:hypothetical protein [Nanoarchaeota archaeon]